MSKYTSHYLTNRSSGTARNHKSRNDRPPTYHWVDNRPEAIDAKASQTLADNSARMQDLMAMQTITNNSPQVSRAARLQRMANTYTGQQQPVTQTKQPSFTGSQPANNRLSENLVAGVRQLSGHSLHDVALNLNSSKPAELNAHAFTQGNSIHVAPGQEKHIPHEAWHVVQQREGRVRPTLQMKGVHINDDDVLEQEADLMGEKALKTMQSMVGNGLRVQPETPWQTAGDHAIRNRPVIQRIPDEDDLPAKRFPNKQPQNLETEKTNFKRQRQFDKGASFIVSYKNRKEFENRLNTGRTFIWVYTVDKDLIIGSMRTNQHPVLADGQDVYCAGECVKPSVSSKLVELGINIENSIEKIATFKSQKKSADKSDRSAYNTMIKEWSGYLKQDKKSLRKEKRQKDLPRKEAADIILINFSSGHYTPHADRERWEVAALAWKKAGYRIGRLEGGFLPPLETGQHLPEEEKPENIPETATYERLINEDDMPINEPQPRKVQENPEEESVMIRIPGRLPLPEIENSPAMAHADNLIKALGGFIADDEMQGILRDFPLPEIENSPAIEHADNLMKSLTGFIADDEMQGILRNFPLPEKENSPAIAHADNLMKALTGFIADYEMQPVPMGDAARGKENSPAMAHADNLVQTLTSFIAEYEKQRVLKGDAARGKENSPAMAHADKLLEDLTSLIKEYDRQ